MVNYDIKKIYEWPPRARALVIVSVSILILILGYVVDIGPYQSQVSNSKAMQDNLMEQLKSMINQQYTIKNDIAQLPAAKALLKKWQENILTKEELPDILNEILKIGQNNNLKIDTFNPGSEAKDGLYYRTPVSIDMTGTFDQIANFISQLANLPRLINIDSFSLSNNPQNFASSGDTPLAASENILSAELDIEIYRK